MSGAGPTRGMPRGLRDTRSWYRDADPMSQVDPALVEFVAARAGRRVLDLGCGLGGYTMTLAERGFDGPRPGRVGGVRGERARARACTPTATTAERCPLDDDSVDTVILIEVHRAPRGPGRGAGRGRAGGDANVLVTTPNCTQGFEPAPIEFSHMLDADHRQFFTVDSLQRAAGGAVRAQRGGAEPPARRDDRERGHAAGAAADLPQPWRVRARRRPRFYSRLLGQGWVGARHDARAGRVRRAGGRRDGRPGDPGRWSWRGCCRARAG